MYELKSEVEGVLTRTRVFYTLDESTEWLGKNVARCLSPPPFPLTATQYSRRADPPTPVLASH